MIRTTARVVIALSAGSKVMEPHAALWGSSHHPVSLAWLFFAAYVIAGLVFAALAAQAAVNRGLNPMVWFCAGLALNIVGYLLLFLRRRELPAASPGSPKFERPPFTPAPLPCPHCGALNHPSAKGCLDCGAKLEPQAVSEVAKSKGA